MRFFKSSISFQVHGHFLAIGILGAYPWQVGEILSPVFGFFEHTFPENVVPTAGYRPVSLEAEGLLG